MKLPAINQTLLRCYRLLTCNKSLLLLIIVLSFVEMSVLHYHQSLMFLGLSILDRIALS